MDIHKVAVPKFVFRQFDMTVGGGEIILDGSIKIVSDALSNHLLGCESCYVFCATLGVEVDSAIRRLQFTDVAAALACDNAANILIEQVCDNVQEQIKGLAFEQGCNITSRFSPGYGDFSLEYQGLVLRLLDAQKQLGVTLTSSNMLLPLKTVTAFIGICRQPAGVVDKCKDCSSNQNCNKRIKNEE